MSSVSTKPYLIRAIYEWCVDQGLTPHLAVLVDEHTVVPPGYAHDGQIVLNVCRDATNNLQMGNETISFQARFGGVSHHLLIPVGNVLAVYARENGHGMAFEPESASDPHPDDLPSEVAERDAISGEGMGADEMTEQGKTAEDRSGPTSRGSHLKVIK